MPDQVIRIHPAAPPKPAWGAACNGCGVCCLAEPCPLGALVSLRRRGACKAVQWSDAERRYRCGMVGNARDHLPRWLHLLAPWLQRVARRLIAAGRGCDSDARVEDAGA